MKISKFVSSAVLSAFLSYLAVSAAHAKEKRWQSTGDYPAKALSEGRQGTVFFEIVVGTNGRGKSCSIVASSGHADLDAAACETVLRRASFNVAKDANGKPVEGIWQSKIEYKLP